VTPGSLALSLTALLVVISSAEATAQEREIGFKLGASIATLNRDNTFIGDDPFDPRAGMTAGAYALLPLRDRVALNLDLLFTEKGGSVPLHDPSVVQGALTTRYKFQYLDLPVLLQLTGPQVGGVTIHAFAGPTMSMRLSAKQQTVFDFAPAGFERDLGGDEMKRFDVGFTVGGGLRIGRVSLDGRYTHGFSETVTDENGSALANRGLLITAGVRVF
jgi:hypothetical protein